MPDPRALTKSGPVHNLFFACIPPDEIKGQIAAAWRSTGTGEDFRHDTLHMSVQAIAALDHLDPIVVDRARLAPLSLRTAPFELCFDRLMRFNGQPGRNALVLGTDGLNTGPNNLAIELHGALRTVGLGPARRKVTSHLTLAYGPGFAETRYLTKPIRWIVRDITLIDSPYGEGRHVILGTWPLPEDRQHPSFDF